MTNTDFLMNPTLLSSECLFASASVAMRTVLIECNTDISVLFVTESQGLTAQTNYAVRYNQRTLGYIKDMNTSDRVLLFNVSVSL